MGKYISSGMSYFDAKLRLNKVIDSLNELVEKLRKNGKDEKTINIKFKEEFEKICMRAEIWKLKKELRKRKKNCLNL